MAPMHGRVVAAGVSCAQTLCICAGIIPPAFDNQLAAQHLAMCNDIGEAAYVDSLVASALVEHLQKSCARSPLAILQKR